MTTSGTSTNRPESRGISPTHSSNNKWLRRFTKLTVASTLFLIFAGGMVTSTDSGLAVPDWPLSYGTLFPPMIGGVFYEHGHRMIASVVGFMTLCLSVWLWMREPRRWVKILGYFALGAVILQGLLGGITVLMLLPTAVSVSHGVLAQTFFLMTIFLAYTQSIERYRREQVAIRKDGRLIQWALLFLGSIYIQLILGAVMRHTGSGLAVYDFPTMAGQWWPDVNEAFVGKVNSWRFDQGLEPVASINVVYHLAHRFWAVVILALLIFVNVFAFRCSLPNKKVILRTVYGIDALIALQVTLGIMTVLSIKGPVITSLHVVTGAGLMGLSFLLLLRISPVKWDLFLER